MNMSIGDIIWATGAQRLQPAFFSSREMRRRVTSAAVDSRLLRPGSLFIALPGQRADGHDYVVAAAAAGAAVALVNGERWRQRQLGTAGNRGDICIIAVEDPLVALQRLATIHRSRHERIRRLAITGSNGKTTLRHILATLLRQRWSTYEPERNLNSDVGLPLAMLGLGADHESAVLELAIDHIGEMDELGAICRPHIAVVTNIGSAHIGPLGSREAIAAEKTTLFRYLRHGGLAVVPETETGVKAVAESLASDFDAQVLCFGPRSTWGYGGSESLGLDGSRIHWEGLQIHFPLFGAHQVEAALAAITVATAVGLEPHQIKAGLESVTPMPGRGQLINGPVTILNDSYNANPESMAAALRFLATLAGTRGRLVAILGSMLELGDTSVRAHKALGVAAAEAQLDAVYFFGTEAALAYGALEERGFSGPSLWTDDYDELAARVAEQTRAGDTVLLKGSRRVALERLVPVLQAA